MRSGRLVFLSVCLALFGVSYAQAAGSDPHAAPLQTVKINLRDKKSLQRGAKLFMNYCAGCHSLQFMRYKQMAKGIGLVDYEGKIEKQLLKDNLIFTGAKPGSQILNAMPASDAHEWFGIAPPDLTLNARVHGANWIYTYLLSFYRDPNRPFGTNNWLYKDVAMPNVLEKLQGEVIPIMHTVKIPFDGGTKDIKVIKNLQLLHSGDMSQHQFKQSVTDIVNFLVYAAEPIKLDRIRIGIWSILFLIVFTLVAYLLKREYWKDIK